jgi:hypothetical protein
LRQIFLAVFVAIGIMMNLLKIGHFSPTYWPTFQGGINNGLTYSMGKNNLFFYRSFHVGRPLQQRKFQTNKIQPYINRRAVSLFEGTFPSKSNLQYKIGGVAIALSLSLLSILLFSRNEYNDPKLNFNLDEMIAKAKVYAESDENLLEYIQDILQDDKFQANPKGYLADWKKKRGYTEELRMPEDQARKFFDKYFLNK